LASKRGFETKEKTKENQSRKLCKQYQSTTLISLGGMYYAGNFEEH
jgi:hypothetical protein